MTTEQQESRPKGILQPNFVTRFLPWIIAGGVLLIYLFTLNHWVTFKSLPVVAKIAGWDWHPANVNWRPSSMEPLFFLLTYPIRWLPANLQMLALNVLSAVCAALTLALLARSVALLPHDRTREQRQRETGKFSLLNIPHSWLPPLVAVLVCGLQLTFWEHAVVATGEMLNMLVFAYVIRCLLEFRISQRESWLTKFALAYGLGVTNNWALIGFFPIFLVALIWIKGLSFFNFRFMLRMIAFGLVGLSLYFVFPIIAAFSSASGQTFWETLLGHLGFQKGFVFNLPFIYLTALRADLFMIGLTSILPLLMIGIHWPSFRGDVSHAGAMITAFAFRLMHLFFLGILLWVFFDPKFSARALGPEMLPLLTFYYLTALAVGYFIGYALLVFGREPVQAWERPSGLLKIANLLILILAWIAVVAVPIAIARKNLPVIQATNSNALSQFAKWTAESLPASGAIVLSDDPARLYLLQAANAQMGKANQNILVETGSLQNPEYHRYLHERYPKDWPTQTSTNAIPQFDLIQQLDALSKTNKLFYLHPSFGYYFEKFYPTPHKLAYQLTPYPTNTIMPPSLSSETITENQNFWELFTKEAMPALAVLGKRSPQINHVNSFYSRSINSWGVELQKAKLLDKASQAFAAAMVLNPENVAAQINQQFNSDLRRGEIRAVALNENVAKKIRQYGWEGALQWNGPFDERDSCLQLGEVFARGGNLRQSAQLFLRVLEFSPKHFGARLGLAKTYIELQRGDEALKLIRQLREEEKTAPLDAPTQIELLRVEYLCHLARNDFKTAEDLLLAAHRQNPKNEDRLALLTQLYLDTGLHTNALETVQKQLQIAPQNPRALFTKSLLHMQFGDFTNAVESLNLILKIQPNNAAALMNRAIANLQGGQLEAAKRDYESLRESQPKNSYRIYYGLAEVAQKQKDKSTAIKNYKLYLKYAPRGTAEYADIQKRLESLQSGKS